MRSFLLCRTRASNQVLGAISRRITTSSVLEITFNSKFRFQRTNKSYFGNRRNVQSQPNVEVPVLIVGAGPVGTYLSILLSKYGIETAIVERSARGGDTNDDGYAHPRAHVLNTRTMEVLRSIGLESSVRAEMPPEDQWRCFRLRCFPRSSSNCWLIRTSGIVIRS